MESVTIDIKREYESGGRESWHKAFSAIDRSQSGTRAFIGAYLKPGEHRLDVGTLIVHVIPTGSVRHRSEVAIILRVTAEQTLEQLTERFRWREQQCSLQDLAATLLGEKTSGQVEYRGLAGFSAEELELELQTRLELAAMKAPPKTKPNSEETSDIDPWDEEDQAPCPYEIPDSEPECPETGGMWRSTIDAAIAARQRPLLLIPDNHNNQPMTSTSQSKPQL